MVLALVAWILAAQRRLEVHRLGRVSGLLEGTSVTVHCQTVTGSLLEPGAELGFVRVGANGRSLRATSIKRDPCKALASYLGGHRDRPSEAEVVAVHVLNDESMHVRGELVEAAAECEAM